MPERRQQRDDQQPNILKREWECQQYIIYLQQNQSKQNLCLKTIQTLQNLKYQFTSCLADA